VMTTSTRPTTYETDFYTWTQQQADLLRQRQIAGLDLENLAEEIESLGKRDRRDFKSRIVRLTQHLLKWQYQQEKRTPSWRATIREQRRKIFDLLHDNPSFKPLIPELLLIGYNQGRKEAADDTDLPLITFPQDCPYTWAQLSDEDWLPD
jgi:hypothetical protein